MNKSNNFQLSVHPFRLLNYYTQSYFEILQVKVTYIFQNQQLLHRRLLYNYLYCLLDEPVPLLVDILLNAVFVVSNSMSPSFNFLHFFIYEAALLLSVVRKVKCGHILHDNCVYVISCHLDRELLHLGPVSVQDGLIPGRV